MCRRGDIYYADLGAPGGSRQSGLRPVLVVSNDTANVHAPLVEQVTTIDKAQLQNQTGRMLDERLMGKVAQALQVQLGIFPKW